MNITLSVPKPVYRQYIEAARLRHKKDKVGPKEIQNELIEHLRRFADIKSEDRVIIVKAKERAALENILGGGSLSSGEQIIERVESLASLRIGDHRLDFTPAQMNEIKHRAEAQGITTEEEFRRVVRKMEQDFFDNLGI